jgi:two-component SAPR family response regulator
MRCVPVRGVQEMSEPGELSGLSIFVLEDERYVANALKRVLMLAGATVHGPFADDEQALHHLGTSLPDCALVDINLGSGPSFETPKFLQAHGIPFVFISGLDEFGVPSEFAHIHLLQKPFNFSDLVDAIVPLTRGSKDMRRSARHSQSLPG